MRVTKSQTSHRVEMAKSRLVPLVHFLNLDPDTASEADVEWYVEWYFPLAIDLGGMLERPERRQEAKRIQTEVKQLLQPIVAPERQLSPDEAHDRVYELIKRINKTPL